MTQPIYEAHRRLTHNTTRWQAYLHEARGAATTESETALHDPIRTDPSYAEAQADDVADLATAVGRELFGRLYADPGKLDKPEAPRWVDRIHDTLDEMPEWEQLRQSVRGDPDFSALATRTMLDAIRDRLPDLIAEEPPPPQDGNPDGDDPGNQDGAPDGTPGGGGAAAPGAGDGQEQAQGPSGAAGAGPPDVGAGDAIRAALRAACRDAAESTNDARSAVGGLAPGMDATPPTDLQRDTARFDLIQAVSERPDLQRILRMAGRIRRIASRAAETRSTDAYEEVVDIELGADIPRLLPTELMMLVDPDLEMVALARIAERRAMQYKLEGHEPLGRGPIIFLRDVSGSMGGAPNEWGAAVHVAMIGQAARERRPLYSALFNSGVHSPRILAPAGYRDLKWAGGTLALGSERASDKTAPGAAALEAAKVGAGGGTNFDRPLEFAFAAGVTEPRADFVFLTDGAAYANETTLERLKAAKRTGLRVYGFTVNGGSISPTLAAICDEMVDVDACRNEGEVSRRLGRALRRAR